VLASGERNFGFDVQALQYGDLVERGVIDPTKVTRSALVHAASAATMLLSTSCTVTRERDAVGVGAGHDHDHEEFDDMD